MDILIATLEDLKKYRPDLCDLLYDEFLMGRYPEKPTREIKSTEEVINDTNGVQKGDAIRWNYTKEEGIVTGFDNTDGICNIIVRRFNGTKILFENDPKLFTILEGEEKANVIAKREKYVAEIKEKKDVGRALIPKKINKKKTIYDGVIYNDPTRRGSKLKVGDHIRFKLTKDVGVVKGFIRKGGLDRILIGDSGGLPESIIDNPEAYEIIDAKPKSSLLSASNNNDSSYSRKTSNSKQKGKNAKIGNWILWKPTGTVGKVIEFKTSGSLRKLVIRMKDGSTQEVYDNKKVYEIIK